MRVDLITEPLDTFELKYEHYACDCPMWNDTFNYSYNDSPTRALLRHYYIEPAAPDLELPDRIGVNGNKVRFIGKVVNEKGYPLNAEFTDPEPIQSKVLRYYGYFITKPYKIWGPKKFLEIDKLSGDSLFETIQLTIKK